MNAAFKDHALQIIQEQQPWQYILQRHNINANLERHFRQPRQQFQSRWDLHSFVITDDMQQWLGKFFEEQTVARPGEFNRFKLKRDGNRHKSLIIEGPSRIGKTQWARSLGIHNYICGHMDFNPTRFSNDVDYNIINDINPKYLHMKH